MQDQPSAMSWALSGFIALAVAMGIGRFAFTPLLPMMQEDAGLGLAQGGWLASANYLGYLAGALAAGFIPLAPAGLLRTGLLLVVSTTAMMGLTDSWTSWLVWRFAAGLGSAMVLVGTASLCLARLKMLGQPQRAGLVFAGVGSGIALAGMLCMILGLAAVGSSSAWLILAFLALLGMLLSRRLWRVDAATPEALRPGAASATAPRTRSRHWRLILCYGLFGFGYILPATFLPAQARLLVEDPAIFGLAWPLFGLAAALSTLLIGSLSARYPRRKLWSMSQLIMAVGVLLPVVWSSVWAIVIAAVCVGGTFMVITMLGMQEAQAAGGAQPKRLIAGVTASFAMGQLIGPIFFSFSHMWLGADLDFALVLATIALIVGCLWLLAPEQRQQTGRSPSAAD